MIHDRRLALVDVKGSTQHRLHQTMRVGDRRYVDAIVDSSKRRAPHFAHATWAAASLCCVLHLSLLRLRLCLPVFIRVVCMSHGATRTIQVCK